MEDSGFDGFEHMVISLSRSLIPTCLLIVGAKCSASSCLRASQGMRPIRDLTSICKCVMLSLCCETYQSSIAALQLACPFEIWHCKEHIFDKRTRLHPLVRFACGWRFSRDSACSGWAARCSVISATSYRGHEALAFKAQQLSEGPCT